MRELDIGQLIAVYDESLHKRGAEQYPFLPQNQQFLRVQQDLYLFLKEFLANCTSFVAFWASDGAYTSVLCAEPYSDGYLITELETAPRARGKGHASALLHEVQQHLAKCGCSKIYSHVLKSNFAALKAHISCGFKISLDYAVLLDGTVSSSYNTLICECKNNPC